MRRLHGEILGKRDNERKNRSISEFGKRFVEHMGGKESCCTIQRIHRRPPLDLKYIKHANIFSKDECKRNNFICSLVDACHAMTSAPAASASKTTSGKAAAIRHAHFERSSSNVDMDEESSERAHEEDQLEFKTRQRRRSSIAKLPKGFTGQRRVSSGSVDSCCT
jgi:hypothetical protein